MIDSVGTLCYNLSMKFKSDNALDQCIALVLIVLGALFRVLPHPDNFTPTMAIALFSGAVLPASLALVVPLLLMMVSDLVIGLHPLFLLVWGSFLAVVLLGAWVRKDPGFGRAAAATLSGSVFFFTVTNLGVFLFENMYEKSWAGLVECFAMALPFFRNSFLGDIFYTASFFSLFLTAQWSHHLFQKSKNF